MSGEIVRLVEEVPGVEENERWYIWKDSVGLLWKGVSAQAGRDWAEANKVGIDFEERFEP